jgi:hypothetical protein
MLVPSTVYLRTRLLTILKIKRQWWRSDHLWIVFVIGDATSENINAGIKFLRAKLPAEIFYWGF